MRPSTVRPTADNVMRDRRAERLDRLRRRSKPLEGQPQGRYRRETKPERFREEQGARRLRKPEGAAQLGEANPAQVASRYLKRRRGQELHEGTPRIRAARCWPAHSAAAYPTGQMDGPERDFGRAQGSGIDPGGEAVTGGPDNRAVRSHAIGGPSRVIL
jgi:hypothetical protein